MQAQSAAQTRTQSGTPAQEGSLARATTYSWQRPELGLSLHSHRGDETVVSHDTQLVDRARVHPARISHALRTSLTPVVEEGSEEQQVRMTAEAVSQA
jgi:hypothetical protein